jgi:hypothetical protein
MTLLGNFTYFFFLLAAFFFAFLAGFFFAAFLAAIETSFWSQLEPQLQCAPFPFRATSTSATHHQN